MTTVTTVTTNAPTDDLLTLFKAAKVSVEIFRSSFPLSDPLSAELAAALEWVAKNNPSVRLEVLTDPYMADTLLMFSVDGLSVLMGPLAVANFPRWLPYGMTSAQWDEFFNDERAILAKNEKLVPYSATLPQPDGTILINDFSRLNETAVHDVYGNGHQRWPFACFTASEADLCNVVAQATRDGMKISVSGRRHSQGGHTFGPGTIVIDILDFDQILAFDPDAWTVRVQSGITWDALQRFLQPHGLGVKVMQAYPYFTVGGALSVNVHESDTRFGVFIQTVNSFRILLADGRILSVSRTENAELFALVIGGFGMFGLVLDVELQLTNDILVQETVDHEVLAADYATTFSQTVADPSVIHAYARPCFSRLDEKFMNSLVFVSSRATPIQGPPSAFGIAEFTYLGLRKMIYDLSRRYEWAKQLRWDIQDRVGDNFGSAAVSRTNHMREDIRIPGDYRSSENTDALQEYFLPEANFGAFLKGLRTILLANEVNVMSCGIRHVPHNPENVMSYSPNGPMFGAIMVINHRTSPGDIAAVTQWTRAIIDLALSLGGTYFLPYAPYATPEQFKAAYPRADEFIAMKQKYDPNTTFSSHFYDNYLKP